MPSTPRTLSVGPIVTCLFVQAASLCFAQGAAPSLAKLSWPREWTAFGTAKKEDPVPAAAVLRSVPEKLVIAGKALRRQTVVFDENSRIDLARLFGGIEVGKTVYLFARVHADSDVVTHIGAGADWWMQWWVDGRPVYDTLGGGNSAPAFSVLDHVFTVPLAKGDHVLAVRVMSGRGSFLFAAGGPGQLAKAGFTPPAEGRYAWIDRIRPDHPRLYFNTDTWPAVKARALGVNADHFAKLADRVAELPDDPAVKDWGRELMTVALVYRMTADAALLGKARKMLRLSLDYYHDRYAQGKPVSWYSWGRVSWLAALDWLWHELDPDERRGLIAGMLEHIAEYRARGYRIRGEGSSGPHQGYYGTPNTFWFAGLLAHNEGIDDDAALALLKKGYDDYRKMLSYRTRAAGDDGGGTCPTLGYTLSDYPLAAWNFFYCWKSALGEDLAPNWPYAAQITNYMIWNWLPGGHHYGYGDCHHIHNWFPRWTQYSHLSNIMHFYARSHPKWAALAHCLRDRVHKRTPTYTYEAHRFSVYPFLMSDLEQAPPPEDPERLLPPARYFENTGQIFMRSDWGSAATCVLFVGGGIVPGHRHWDATHFTVFKQGFLALDTGTRQGGTQQPWARNYYLQTVAHNCILIHMPNENPRVKAGGQNSYLGSKIIAFETQPAFTYAACDATPVYDARKCSLMVRQLVFVPPVHVVVFDRAIATEAAYRKQWLLHTANEPVLEGTTFRADQAEGRLFCRTLLPEDAVQHKVGGPGREFMADGVNWAFQPEPRLKKPEGWVPEYMGRWRVEVEPGAARLPDVFLHLIQVGDRDLEAMDVAQASVAADRVTLTVARPRGELTLSFATRGEVGGHICIRDAGRIVVDRELTRRVAPQAGLAAAE